MGLIDKDAAKADIEKFNRPLCDGYHMKDYVLNQIITDIDNQPTVEAIPIEWLEKCKDRYILCCTIIDDIIEEWREENGKV